MATVQDTWRTVRFFLDEDGVFEVMFDHTGQTTALRCNCPSFSERGGCRHIGWITKHHMPEVWDHIRQGIRTEQRDWRRQVLTTKRVEVV